MATKITKEDLDKLIFDGQEYAPDELKDIISQLEIEKNEPDGGDVIVFRGKRYDVNKCTYDVIRKTKQTLIFRRYAKSLYERLLELDGKKVSTPKLAWLRYIPFVFRIIDTIDNWQYKKSWLHLCKLTFGDNAKDFALGGLTTQEVQRVMRIFFRFQAELFPAVQENVKKPSSVT